VYEYWHRLAECGERTLAILLSRSLWLRAEVCCCYMELLGVERDDWRCDGKKTTTAGDEYEIS